MARQFLIFILSIVTVVSSVAQSKYDSLLKIYQERKGSLSAEDQMYLTIMSRRNKKDSLANIIATTYISTLSDEDALKLRNIRFIIGNTVNTSDRGFKLYELYPIQIDTTIKDPGFAEKTMSAIIIRDEKLLDGSTKEPNWKSSYKLISHKYNSEVAERTVAIAKIKYYKSQKDSIKYTQAIASLVNKYGSTMSNIDINNYGYEIFLYSSNNKYLNEAIKWLEPIINIPSASYLFIDTYANLLYKIRCKAEALKWEEKAHDSAPWNKDVALALIRMQKGEKTW